MLSESCLHKILWEEPLIEWEIQNMKNFTLTFKSILLYIHKRGGGGRAVGRERKTTEGGRERRSTVTEVDLRSSSGLRCAGIFISAASPVLVSSLLSCGLETQHAG